MALARCRRSRPQSWSMTSSTNHRGSFNKSESPTFEHFVNCTWFFMCTVIVVSEVYDKILILIKIVCRLSSYVAYLRENAPEGTALDFSTGLDLVENLDKVRFFFVIRKLHHQTRLAHECQNKFNPPTVSFRNFYILFLGLLCLSKAYLQSSWYKTGFIFHLSLTTSLEFRKIR